MFSLATNYHVRLGFCVLPVARGQKAPSVTVNGKTKNINWKQYIEVPPSIEQLKEWFEGKAEEDIGIGLLCGKASGVVVVDDDNHDGRFRKEFASPVRVKTGNNGYHTYFKYPEEGLSRELIDDQKLDIRGDNHFVVLPPTLHAKTNVPYEWDTDGKDVFEAIRGLPELPLIPARDKNHEEPDQDIVASFDLNSRLNVAEGERNDALTAIAGKFWSQNMGKKELKAILEQVNANYSPPLSNKEVQGIYKSIISRPRNSFQLPEEQLPIIDTSSFKEMTVQQVLDVLGLTIKRDEENKLVTFLTMLTVYTDNNQMNLSFNAPSSSGKSYIPMETSALFPKRDVKTIGYSSPTAFFHAHGNWDSVREVITIDLSGKIIIFQDQPHNQLLERLRPLLSHDEKVINVQVTDKQQKAGIKTKNVELIGFPVVIFCSAGMSIDEQESTRFLLLSPDSNQEKIREAVSARLEKEANAKAYYDKLDSDPGRQHMKERIIAIRQSGIKEIDIGHHRTLIEELFWSTRKTPKNRHSRDISRVISLIKALVLLNLWFRDRDGDTVFANEEDVREAFKIWDKLSAPQEYNLPPYVYRVYWDVIVPCFQEREDLKQGVTKKELAKKYYQVHGTVVEDHRLRQQILPALETAGLIDVDLNPTNRREKLYTPVELSSEYSEPDGGVDNSKLVEEIFGITNEQEENNQN